MSERKDSFRSEIIKIFLSIIIFASFMFSGVLLLEQKWILSILQFCITILLIDYFIKRGEKR